MKSWLLIGCSMLFCASPVLADELIESCNSCHGANGVSTEPTIPTIAGLSQTSLEDMLYAYKDETRPAAAHDGKDMITIAAELSEDQISALAEHYSALKFVPAKQEFDATKAATGEKIHASQCEKCHSEGGSVADDDAGILAGQWAPYLKIEIDAYLDGSREGDASMVNALKAMKPEHIDALLHYYASQQ
jgi:sulfide dehydrogenase cytochrome subunit